MNIEQSPQENSNSQAGLASFQEAARPSAADVSTALVDELNKRREAEANQAAEREANPAPINSVPGFSDEAVIVAVPTSEAVSGSTAIDVSVDESQEDIVPVRTPIIDVDQVPKSIDR